jgi:hypothetical protein
VLRVLVGTTVAAWFVAIGHRSVPNVGRAISGSRVMAFGGALVAGAAAAGYCSVWDSCYRC